MLLPNFYMENQMLNLKKIDHIAIATDNLKKSIKFFKYLGFKCEKIEVLVNRGIKIALINIGHVHLELISPLCDNSEISHFLNKKGPGLHHIAFETTNILSDMRNLQICGLNLISNQTQKGAFNTRVNFIHPKNSEKILVELVEKQF